MSSIPPVGDGPAATGAPVPRDRTPEREEVERTIAPVGSGRFGGNRTGAIVGIAAVVAALFFINVGGTRRDSTATKTIAMTPDAKARPDQRAAQTQQFDPGIGQPGGPPNLSGTAAGRMTTLPDGTVVPAITPGALPPGGEMPADGRGSAESFADKSRRAPMLVSITNVAVAPR